MHKIKIILLSLIGITAIFVTIMAFILSSYNNQDFRQLLIKTVDNLSDYTLAINGPFELHRSFTPVLSASDIELHSKTDNSYISIDNFKVQITLAPLLNNTLLINDFLLENMRIDIQTSEKVSNPVNLVSYFPVPIIEHAVLKNIQLIIDNEPHTLDSLVLSAKNRLAPLNLRGTGMFKGQIFDIEGQLGPLTDIFAQQKPYPINLLANWKQVQLSINGTIADPADGEGLDLVGKINIPELADLVAATTPVKGHLYGKVHINGDFDEPELAELQVTLIDKQSIDLKITGHIGNLISREQTQLHLSGFIHDAELLKWAMPEISPTFNIFNIETDIIDDSQAYTLQNININLSTAQGFKVNLSGNTHLVMEEQPFRSLDIQAEISSKNTATIKPYLGNILPEMGPVKGSARITSQGKNFVMSNIDLLAGVDKKIQLTAKGRVGHLSISPHSDDSKISLDLALTAENSTELTSLLGIKHPEIGPVSIDARLKGSVDKLKLDDIKLTAGHPGVLSILANGSMSWDKLDTDSPEKLVDFTIQANTPSLRDASRLYGVDLPNLGVANASMRIHGTGMILAGSDLTMKIGTENSILLKIQGKVAQIFYDDLFYKGIDLTGTLTGKSTSHLSALLENSKIPDIGPVSGKLMITGDSNKLRIPQISLSAGRKNKLMFSVSGKIAEIPLRQQVPPRGVDIILTVTAPKSTDISSIVRSEIPELGRLLIKGRLTDHNGIYAIEDLILTAGNPKQAVINISGSVEDVFSTNRLQMKVLFDENTLVKLFDLHPIPELGQLTGSALLSNASGNFGLKDIKLKSGNSELIDFKLIGAIEDIAKTGEIRANADISIQQPELFGILFATDLSGFGPITASGLISGNKNKMTFKGNTFVGRTKLNSELAWSLNEKAEISGIINSPNLFLEDFGVISAVSATSQTEATTPAKKALFSQTPLALQSLHKVDLDLKLRIFKMTGIDYNLDKVNIDLLLQNGKLTARPVNFDFSGGQVSMSAEIDAMEKYDWSWSMQGDNIQLAEAFGQKNKPPLLEGDFNFLVDLKSSGINAREIASNLKGEFGFTLESGGISRSQLELVFLNPLGWLFSHGITGNEFHISCGLARYQIKQGVIKSKVFLIDGPKLLVRGKEEINLASETINSLYNLEKKNIFENTIVPTFAATSVPIKVSGNLSDPTIEQAPIPSVISKADRYIFAPVATIPQEVLGTVFGLFDKNKEAQSPCKSYLEN